jgi:cyclophilin family peptidyl-prolyl cis-trans isomerase/predicted DsbA family dithiol-disulfide isomerase
MKINKLSFFLLALVFLQGLLVTQASADTNPEVVFETSKGSFSLELYPDKAPLTVANFLAYVDEGFYDNTIFHRVIPDFVIQGGGFESGMKPKETRQPVKNESSNRLKNIRGTVSMARRTHPDTATSQFFINLKHNSRLDYVSKHQPGYTVFGRISKGMDVIDRISVVETAEAGGGKDVPVEDVVVISVGRKVVPEPAKDDKKAAAPVIETVVSEQATEAVEQKQDVFVAGEHYVVLDKPVATRDSSKIEVVEMFSYGCPHCYEFEAHINKWGKQQGGDVDFWYSPAVWSKTMELYARAFYAARELNVMDEIHFPLFTSMFVEQRKLSNENELAEFFAEHGVDKEAFTEAMQSPAVIKQAEAAEARVRSYKPVGVPEIIVNGKYRVDRMHAGGLTEMLTVTDYLVNKERTALKN